MPSTFSWNCKNSVNTSIFCDQLAKNAVIYSVFFLLGFQKHWYLRCFVHLRSKKYWYLQHFLLFFIAPAKDVKTQKCCNSKSEKSSEKCVKTALFSDFRYPQNGGGGCSWRRLWATRIPAKKLSPTLLKDFWWFSGPGVGGSAAGGAPHLRALVALGRSSGKPLVGSRRSRIFGLTPLVGSAGPLGPPFHRSVGVKVTEWGPASEIYSLGFLERICWNRRFFGEQVSSRKLLRRVFPKELLPISTCYFV